MSYFDRWQDVSNHAWVWPNFTPQEMACKGSGSILIVPEFMDKLQLLRTQFGEPVVISSGYRSPAHNNAVSSTGHDGPHTTGRAADIKTSHNRAFEILAIAPGLGFTGIGIKQKGPHAGRFIHLDDLGNEDTKGLRPTVWSY